MALDSWFSFLLLNCCYPCQYPQILPSEWEKYLTHNLLTNSSHFGFKASHNLNLQVMSLPFFVGSGKISYQNFALAPDPFLSYLIYSFIEYLLSTSCVPGIVIDIWYCFIIFKLENPLRFSHSFNKHLVYAYSVLFLGLC